MDLIKKLVNLELIRGLSTRRYELEGLYPLKKMISTNFSLELLHLDLYGPINIPSISRKKVYALLL
jgi:hypothetical protein